MIAYNLIITEGCIHKPFMEVQIGTKVFGIDCQMLRGFIHAANEYGIYEVLKKVNPRERRMYEFLYDEFKDEVIK